MFRGSRPHVRRALENRENPPAFGLGPELRCNPDDLRVEFAGYWSRLLLRVRRRSEVVDQKPGAEEVRS